MRAFIVGPCAPLIADDQPWVRVGLVQRSGSFESLEHLHMRESDAHALIATFCTVEQAREYVAASYSTVPYVEPHAVQALFSLSQRLGAKQTAFLDQPELKYINIRVDMRGGSASFTGGGFGSSPDSCIPQLLDLATKHEL